MRSSIAGQEVLIGSLKLFQETAGNVVPEAVTRVVRAFEEQGKTTMAISLGVIALLIITSVAGLVELSGAVILHEGSTIVVLNDLRLLG